MNVINISISSTLDVSVSTAPPFAWSNIFFVDFKLIYRHKSNHVT